jgi:hypothetical protein
MRMRAEMGAGITALMLMLSLTIPACAEETKVKSVEVVPETAVVVLQKVNAFFQGDLTWTMPSGKGKYKDDYIVDPQGNKLPRSTLGKYDDGVR